MSTDARAHAQLRITFISSVNSVELRLGLNDFLERPAGVAFWTMMLLSSAFLVYSYVVTQTANGVLLSMLLVALVVFRGSWVVYAWRRPLSVPMEKVERAAFWVTILLVLGLLTIEFLTASLFDYYLFCVFAVGLLIYCAHASLIH